MSRYEYPEDEFDVVEEDGAPEPIGVHRAKDPAWRSWAPLLAILVIVPLLAWGAVALLGRNSAKPAANPTQNPAPAQTSVAAGAPAATTPGPAASASGPASQSAAPSASASSTATANVDLTTGVTVYNGTTTSGLAGRTGDRLTNAGYAAVTVPQGTYPNENPTVSTVFYARAENKATAEAIASTLGISQVMESPAEAQSNPVVVVLRSDYHE